MTIKSQARHFYLTAIVGALIFAGCTTNATGGSPRGQTTTGGSTTTAAGLRVPNGSNELPQDEATVMADPSVTFTKPVDKRLNGYDFSLQVLGYGRAGYVSTNTGGYKAPAGDTIVVVD